MFSQACVILSTGDGGLGGGLSRGLVCPEGVSYFSQGGSPTFLEGGLPFS